MMKNTNQEVILKLAELYMELFKHEGFGELSIDMKLCKRTKKEVVLKCGREYRYVVDWNPQNELDATLQA